MNKICPTIQKRVLRSPQDAFLQGNKQLFVRATIDLSLPVSSIRVSLPCSLELSAENYLSKVKCAAEVDMALFLYTLLAVALKGDRTQVSLAAFYWLFSTLFTITPETVQAAYRQYSTILARPDHDDSAASASTSSASTISTPHSVDNQWISDSVQCKQVFAIGRRFQSTTFSVS